MGKFSAMIIRTYRSDCTWYHLRYRPGSCADVDFPYGRRIGSTTGVAAKWPAEKR